MMTDDDEEQQEREQQEREQQEREQQEREQQERELSQLERVQKFVRPRLERAERAYSQALTSLWLGNAGAALATLSFIGAAWQKGTFHRSLLVPLFSFVLGLILMGLGSTISLVKEARIIKRMERARSWLEFRVGDVKSSTEQAGLVLDWRTWTAILAASIREPCAGDQRRAGGDIGWLGRDR
jgi:hypothetical protein